MAWYNRYNGASPQQKQLKSKGRFFYGWIIVVACLAAQIILGATHYSFGIFFKLLQHEFGWGRTLTSSANTVSLFVFAASVYIMPPLVEAAEAYVTLG